MIDSEIGKVEKLYECQIPRGRTNPSGKEMDDPYTTDPQTGMRFITVTSNAAAIVQVKQILSKSKTLIRDAGNLGGILEILRATEKEVDRIDLKPLPVKLEEGDLARVDPGRANEMAVLFGPQLNAITPPERATSGAFQKRR